MPSLLDLAPPHVLRRQIETSRGKVNIEGIGASVWAQLYEKHPAISAMVLGQMDGLSDRLETVRATAALIAAGTGHPLEAEHELAARTLTSGDQSALVAGIMEISSPGDMFGPLLDAADREKGRPREPDGAA